MIYLDTSVLLVYTLAQAIEPVRFVATQKLFAKINNRTLEAVTSFYSLHEVFVFALENAPDFDTGSDFGKSALTQILLTPIKLTPLISRTERQRHLPKFRKLLADFSDIPHAISALISGCDTIVAYDDHFKRISKIIKYQKPEDLV